MSETSCAACGEVWPTPPTWKVACPDCGAAQHRPCKTKRPSGHALSDSFASMHPWGCVGRERLALSLNLIPMCPMGATARNPQPELAL